ncbi:MAG TPA: DUF2202 domain-containing protein [Dermatophilaceae bacterium]|nr:DUF2202 domain-containing protein [Dermatophilaceae bacterium]
MTAAALGVAALLAGGVAASQALATTETAPSTTAAGGVASALTFSREEERMARDLYAALADSYDGARPFSMITKSEDRHFDAVGALIERYDVADPSAGKAAGTYSITAIQDLYDGWLAEGRASLEGAYRVGVELEQRDIADLRQSIAADLPADVDTVLGQLLQGSHHHLAAYQRAVAGGLGSRTGVPGGRRGDTATSGRGTGRMGNGSGNGSGDGFRGGNGGSGSGFRGGNGAGTGGDCPYADEDAS